MSLDPSDMAADKGRTRHVLYEVALETLKKQNGPVLEIGCWRGCSALALMRAIVEAKGNHMLVTVDPYIPNPSLTDELKAKAIPAFDLAYQEMKLRLATESVLYGVMHVHYKMTDLQFIENILKLPLFWGNVTVNKFAFIHLDGGHEMESEKMQVMYLIPLLAENGNILIDDVNDKRADKLESWLLEKYKGHKISEEEWVLK